MSDKCKNVKCPRDKICNPETGRCVLKTGKIGKALLKSRASPRRASPRRASPRRASPRRASPRRASPRRASPLVEMVIRRRRSSSVRV